MSEDCRNDSLGWGSSACHGSMPRKCVRELEQRCRASQSLAETGSVYLADYAHVGHLIATPIEEQDGRGAEQFVAVQQAALGGVAFGDVEADQTIVGQSRCHLWVGEH